MLDIWTSVIFAVAEYIYIYIYIYTYIHTHTHIYIYIYIYIYSEIKFSPNAVFKFYKHSKVINNQSQIKIENPFLFHDRRIKCVHYKKCRIEVLFKFLPFPLSSPIVLFTLRQDGHLPIPDRHHIEPYTCGEGSLSSELVSLHDLQFSYYLLFVLFFSLFSLFSCYVPFSRLNKITFSIFTYGGTRWRSWLTHCATNRKVAG